MYTQCPDCEVAFRVTAGVLKQAAGQVRCGGCGSAFNALSYLSEKMPGQPVAREASAALPELRPEIIETESGPPHSVSAEQSAALLKTLDELAGSDIRIEDTGVEWRVLDEDEAAAAAADDDDADLGTNDEYQENEESPDDEADEPIESPAVQQRFDDNTQLPDDFGPENESSYTTTSEPMFDTIDEDDDPKPLYEEPQPEITLSEPDEWQDILGEFLDLAEEVAAPIEGIDREIDTEDVAKGETAIEHTDIAVDEPLDMDTQFALQAEAMGIDLSGINELESDEDDLAEDLDDVLEDESEESVTEETPDEELQDDFEFLGFEDANDDEGDPELDSETEQLELIEEQAVLIVVPVVESHSIEDELAADDFTKKPADEAPSEHYVPPMTEEEHTVNMQIDQDLMALAIEDEDGFASTIIMPGKDAEKKALEEKVDMGKEDDEPAEAPATTSGFEMIIMEGELIRNTVDSEKLAADAAAAAELVELARADENERAEKSGGSRYGMIAAAVLLMLTLAVQMVHQSREALATIPAFSSTVGQLYRAIGRPVQPAWDITGWRFEATKGSTEGEDEDLTVYSRLGNNSDGPLPYPLIGISLTDRFEESIGSRVLDPAEYLASDLDPRKLVEPGDTFNAVITIKSASEDATGFKLNVCYRSNDGQLRCAIDDFK